MRKVIGTILLLAGTTLATTPEELDRACIQDLDPRACETLYRTYMTVEDLEKQRRKIDTSYISNRTKFYRTTGCIAGNAKLCLTGAEIYFTAYDIAKKRNAPGLFPEFLDQAETLAYTGCYKYSYREEYVKDNCELLKKIREEKKKYGLETLPDPKR